MDCKAWENEISRREADLLDAGQQNALDAHLAGCPLCREVSDRVRQGIQAMSAMPITPAPKSFLEDSWRRIQKATPQPVGPLERLKRWFGSMSQPPVWLPLGAAAAVVLAITVLPTLRDGGAAPAYRILAQSGAVKVEPTPNGGVLLETQGGTLEVEHVGRARYVLAGTGNKLAIGLGRPDHIELTDGAAEVKVQADPSRPYAVEIAGARVVVTGTFFKLTNGTPPQVELIEGKIKLMGPDWSRDVKPGEKLSWLDSGPIGADGAAAPPLPVAATSAAPSAVPAATSPAVTSPAGVRPSPGRSPGAGAARPIPSPAKPALTAGLPSPVAPPPPTSGAGEINEGSGQLNDPFQGR